MNSKRLKIILITNLFTYDDHFEQDGISKQGAFKDYLSTYTKISIISTVLLRIFLK